MAFLSALEGQCKKKLKTGKKELDKVKRGCYINRASRNGRASGR